MRCDCLSKLILNKSWLSRFNRFNRRPWVWGRWSGFWLCIPSYNNARSGFINSFKHLFACALHRWRFELGSTSTMRSGNLASNSNFLLASCPFELLVAVVKSILAHRCCLHLFCDPCTVELRPMLLVSIFDNKSVVLVALWLHTLTFWCIACCRLAPLRVIAAISLDLSARDWRLAITIHLATTIWILSRCFLSPKTFAPYFYVQDIAVLFVSDVVFTINLIFTHLCWWSWFLLPSLPLFQLRFILLHNDLDLLLVSWSVPIRSDSFFPTNLIFVSLIEICQNLIKLCFHFPNFIVWLRVFFLQTAQVFLFTLIQ